MMESFPTSNDSVNTQNLNVMWNQLNTFPQSTANVPQRDCSPICFKGPLFNHPVGVRLAITSRLKSALACDLVTSRLVHLKVSWMDHKWTAFILYFYPQHFTILSNIYPFMHTFTRRRCQPCKATASLSRAVRVRCLTPRHFDTHS